MNWDVTHKQALELVEKDMFVFDPLLSYETSKYRPLTQDVGLDFPVGEFTAVGDMNLATGRYSGLREGSRGHIKWWQEQYERCNEGYEYKDYRVTGKHYFFLNFYTLNKYSVNGNTKIHPKFWEIHYRFFHYLDLAEKLGYDVCALKARGVNILPSYLVIYR